MMLAEIRSVASRLGEDLRFAVSSQILTGVAGSWWTPRAVRRLIFRAAGAQVGSAPGPGFVLAGRARNLSLGHSVYFNQRVFIEAVGRVEIGDHSAIGMEAMILTSHHRIDRAGRWSDESEPRPVLIGERVWIGARSLILPGTIIESNVVVAAGAVVTGHLRSFGVYAGVPARRIRDYSPEGANIPVESSR